jgi:16S rRNA (cytidine1402-2'-O)-methyltransferase
MNKMLYVVGTPIGNLNDISRRAIEVLGGVDVVACEDTRVTGKLMSALETETELVSFHEHSGQVGIKRIADRLEAGETVALVSDAGTPGVSDPGSRLVDYVTRHVEDVDVVPIPGPNAAVAALSVSGFPADRFVFLGFPPHKKKREAFFAQLEDTKSTVVFYESKHRIEKALSQMEDYVGERPVMIGRELTKKFESIYRGTLEEVTKQLMSDTIKGEFVIVIGPK